MSTYSDKSSAARALNRDEVVWLWNTSKLTSGQLARKFKVSKGVVLGIIHRDPRAIQRRPPSPIQKANRRIAALEAEVKRLQALEVSRYR